MITKIDLNSNISQIENLPFLNRFSINSDKLKSITSTIKEKTKNFVPFEYIKKHKNYISLVMSSILIGGMILVRNTPYYYGVAAVSCLANTTTPEAVATGTTVTQIWERLKPLTTELMGGADVLGVLALIYCGILLLMGQPSKGKKVFKNAIGGYLLIRLSPVIIDIVGVFSKITLG